MATATLQFDRQLPRKNEQNESGAQDEKIAQFESVTGAGADYFEIITRATNDTLRDWDVSRGALRWAGALDHLLGPERVAAETKIGFWFQHLHPDDLARIQANLRDAFDSRAERWMGEYRFRLPNGEYAHILERALIFRDERGGAIRLVGTMMDVTTGRQLHAQACRSQRMEAFGQLAGGVAHDFNNFLTTILGYSDLLLSEATVSGRIASQIKEIRDAAGRASGLTNQLLAFSRRQSLEPTVLEVNRLITNLERSLLRLLGDNISIVCHLHHLKEGAHIKVDANQFTQIILNLAVNARDAMPKGGRLTITTSILKVPAAEPVACHGTDLIPGEYVVIAMSDNGVGMSEEVKGRLFEPFFTTKEDSHSSGLGLATSYGIVRQSGGQICAESAPGEGSIFRIFLPRVAAPPSITYRKPGQRKPVTGTETILVLEDDAGVRHLSVRVLRNLGYEVLEAANGEDAKRLITQRDGPTVDLVLTDMVMPEISGRHFADWLRQTSPATKVVFISGYLEESLHPRDRRDPEMYFLAKPFNAEQLAGKVRDVLDEKVAG
ncbi:MAG: response regulator [Chthoniobacterales bacterium]|nr:response regulator [Chthoniobacterales bacterium]